MLNFFSTNFFKKSVLSGVNPCPIFLVAALSRWLFYGNQAFQMLLAVFIPIPLPIPDFLAVHITANPLPVLYSAQFKCNSEYFDLSKTLAFYPALIRSLL